jgi:hypothetical protein
MKRYTFTIHCMKRMQVREDGSTRAQGNRNILVNVMYANKTKTASMIRCWMKTEMVVASCDKDRDIDINGIGLQTEIVGPIRFAKYT